MKNTFKLFAFIVGTMLGLTACPPDEMETNEYDACCGIEPVEFSIAGTNAYVYIPNAFTPNGDGINDSFMPIINTQFLYLNYMVITREVFDDTTSSILYQVQNIDPAQINQAAWNGHDSNGQLHKGVFDYTMSITTPDGLTYVVSGRGCSILCDPESSIFNTKEDCFFPSQSNSEGHLDLTLSNGEVNCF